MQWQQQQQIKQKNSNIDKQTRVKKKNSKLERETDMRCTIIDIMALSFKLCTPVSHMIFFSNLLCIFIFKTLLVYLCYLFQFQFLSKWIIACTMYISTKKRNKSKILRQNRNEFKKKKIYAYLIVSTSITVKKWGK